MRPPNEDKPLLSIVIVTYNAEDYLPRTLSALTQQVLHEPGKVEVIAIDGKSTDNTVRLLKSCPAVTKVISEADNGIYDAMNKGALLATGDWLHFLNAGDSFSSPEALDLILKSLSAANEEGTPWVVAGAQNLGGGGEGIARRIPSLPHSWWRHAYGIQPHCHQATWFMRSVLIDSGLHSLNFGTAGDFDVILRFGLLARPKAIDSVLIDYLGGGVSQVHPRITAALQSKVRSERFNLDGPLKTIDSAVGQFVGLMNTARIGAGRFRGHYLESR